MIVALDETEASQNFGAACGVQLSASLVPFAGRSFPFLVIQCIFGPLFQGRIF
jgi:hypothetical protein